MPTPSPGCHLVPRWRTMMLPAMTCSPPNFFTPRRRPAESRPLREEPPAFLCAISNYLSKSLFGGAGFSLRLRGLFGGLLFFSTDGKDAQQSHLLAMARLAAIVVATALLEDHDLLGLRLGDDLGRDRHLGGVGDLAVVAREQHVTQGDLVTGLTSQL